MSILKAQKQIKSRWKSTLWAAISLFFVTVMVGCNTTTNSEETTSSDEQRPILVEGPMPIEAEAFADRLENVEKETSGIYDFYIGTVDDYPVIVVKTSKGMENAAAATAVAIERYNPIAIISQGTSGGHDPSLNVFVIVLGKRRSTLASA